MASIKSLLLSAGLVAFLVGQHCCAHMLFNRLIEGERQLCPNVDCSTKPSCSSNGQCPSQQCCIDINRSKACCYSAGQPINPPITTIAPTASPTSPTTPTTPTTTASQTATSGPGSSPAAPATTTTAASGPPTFCGALTQAQACAAASDKCHCTNNEGCYINEICCLAKDGAIYVTRCHIQTPAPTIAPPSNPGGPCPRSIPNPVCIPGLATVAVGGGTCSDMFKCRSDEVCCIVYRDWKPCCVKLTA